MNFTNYLRRQIRNTLAKMRGGDPARAGLEDALESAKPQASKRRLLWIGDAVAATGFSRATHYILDVLRHDWDVHVLGINYHGDPHPYPYPIYPAAGFRQDVFGVKRSGKLISQLRPDITVVLNDPWNIPAYMKQAGNANLVGFVAVDGLNCRGAGMNGLLAAVFWTQFGLEQAQLGGFRGTAGVVPLGVDLEIYKPLDRGECRDQLGLPPKVRDGFIVGNINRNQPRKRLDLTMMYFAEWIRSRKIDDAYLYLHVAPTGEQGYEIDQLGRYLGILNKVIIAEPDIGMGVPESRLCQTYNAFDVQVSTTQGEGFGLTTLEGQACGIPQIAPDWAALGEIVADSALLVPCTSVACTPNNINAIGGIADREEFIECLDRVYREPAARADLRERGIENAGRDCYRWPHIGAAFGQLLEQALDPTRLTRVSDGGTQQAGGRGGDGAQNPQPRKEVS